MREARRILVRLLNEVELQVVARTVELRSCHEHREDGLLAHRWEALVINEARSFGEESTVVKVTDQGGTEVMKTVEREEEKMGGR